MRVYVATKNPGKFRELQAILGTLGWEALTFEGYADVAEGESSYTGNAALKARALREQLDRAGISDAAIGDDSGLEVAALGGRPGVLSARYGGVDATWSERRHALLREAAESGSADRGARFVCALHLVDRGGREWSACGTLDGRLAGEERGDGGFSYDAIFEDEDGRTFAELSAEEKNAVSHRARAAKALVEVARPESSRP